MKPSDPGESIRLNRYLALLGLGSRRACDDLILDGKIRVDGNTVNSPGIRIIPGVNLVSMGHHSLDAPPRRIVILMHKPEGMVTTASDPEGRKTVMDLCKAFRFTMRLFPVGRLDINTTGAILLTNDGLLCYRLTHPSFQVPRTYVVQTRGALTDKKIKRLEKLTIPTFQTKLESTPRPQIVHLNTKGREHTLKIVLYEGQNRQVRNVCQSVALRVVKLKRVSYGPISIRRLPVGTVRALTKKELQKLYRMISLERCI
jgi:23S rRNA pseudouridine2605 synthase